MPKTTQNAYYTPQKHKNYIIPTPNTTKFHKNSQNAPKYRQNPPKRLKSTQKQQKPAFSHKFPEKPENNKPKPCRKYHKEPPTRKQNS